MGRDSRSREKRIKRIQDVARAVALWPKWKQNILEDSANPERRVPRKPTFPHG